MKPAIPKTLPPPVRAHFGEDAAIRPIPAKHGGRR